MNSRALALIAAITIPAAAFAAPILYSVQSNGDDHLYSIDAATGVATDLGKIDFDDAEGLAFAGSTLYAIGGTEEVFWNITSPPGALVGSTGLRLGLDAGLDFNTANGLMYNIQGAGSGTSSLYTINLATGAATLVGSGSAFADGLAIDAAGNAFGIDGIFSESLYSIDLATGATTLIGGLGVSVNDQFGLTFAGGTLYALSSSGNIYTINTGTGAASLVSSTTCAGVACDDWEGLAAPQAVPEPGTLALLSLGLAGLAATRRRKQ